MGLERWRTEVGGSEGKARGWWNSLEKGVGTREATRCAGGRCRPWNENCGPAVKVHGFTRCVTLGKWLNLPQSHFPHL